MSLFVDAFNNSCNPFSILVRVVRSIIIDNGWCTRVIFFFLRNISNSNYI